MIWPLKTWKPHVSFIQFVLWHRHILLLPCQQGFGITATSPWLTWMVWIPTQAFISLTWWQITIWTYCQQGHATTTTSIWTSPKATCWLQAPDCAQGGRRWHVNDLQTCDFPSEVQSFFNEVASLWKGAQAELHAEANGRSQILQYCLQNMGGKQFRCFDLSADVSVSKKSKVFDELEDDDLDKGFDFLTQNAPRSASDLQQLRWQTKQLRSPTSPICGWPQALVQQALRLLSSEGALARKEYHWPLPLTEKFYHTWLLEILEAVWDFYLSSLVMLGEPAAGKSPLGRSVLAATIASASIKKVNPVCDARRKLISCEASQALLSWATSLMTLARKALAWRLWSPYWMSASVKACPGLAGVLWNGFRTSPEL